MLTLDDVRRLAAALPEVRESDRRGNLTWAVGAKTFGWERPFSKADVKRFGDEVPPPEPIVAVRVADQADKAAVLAAGHPGVFTIAHFDGFAAVLICLQRSDEATARELLEDAWLCCAPPALAAAHPRQPS